MKFEAKRFWTAVRNGLGENALWLGLLVCVITVGIFSSILSVDSAKQRMLDDVRRAAYRAALSVNHRDLDGFGGTAADRATPLYGRLRVHLMALLRVNSAWSACYLLRMRDDGQFCAFLNVRAPNRHFASPPPAFGHVFHDPPLAFARACATGQTAIEYPYHDARGDWVSAFAPLVDPATGVAEYVLGADVPVGDARDVLWRALWFPLGCTVAMLLVLLVGFVLFCWRKNHPDRLDFILFWTILCLGGLLALLTFVNVREYERATVVSGTDALAERKIDNAFRRFRLLSGHSLVHIADSCARIVRNGAPAASSNEIDALASFFERESFMRFLGIYDMGHARLHVHPGGAPQPFDLAPYRDLLDSDAARAGLAVATDLLPPNPARGFPDFYQLVFVRLADHFGSILGWVVCVFEPHRFFAEVSRTDIAQNWRIDFGLVMLDAATGRITPLAGDIGLPGTERRIQPVMAFGHVYVLVAFEDPVALVQESIAASIVAAIVFLFLALFAYFVHYIEIRHRRQLYNLDTRTNELDAKAQELSGTRADLGAMSRRYVALVANIPGVVFRCDARKDIWTPVYVSAFVYRVTGYKPEDFTSGRIHFLDLLAPPDRARFLAATATALQERSELVIEGDCCAKDGTVRRISARTAGVHDESGQLVGVVGILFDVSDRVAAEAERDALRAHLEQSAKMESIGRLAGGIAHDFNNMLQAILGFAELGLSEDGLSPAVKDDFTEVQTAARRAADLTRQLLLFSRKSPVSAVVAEVSVKEAVTALGSMLGRLIGPHIRLATIPSPDAPVVRIDRSQLDQLITNLVVNARDALADRPDGMITLAVARKEFAVPVDVVQGTLPAGAYAVISVADNGTGIPPDIRDKIFEPFFTTKGAGRGTGLGLATVYGVTHANGGGLLLTTAVGHGTTFEILLPVAKPAPVATPAKTAAAPAAAVPSAADMPRGTEVVLVVDDESSVAASTARMLSSLGYRVFTATKAAEAEAAIRGPAAAAALVVSDVVMPVVSGPELVARLRRIRPGLRALFMSGYTSTFMTPQSAKAPFIPKPFTREALARIVRAVLDAPAPASQDESSAAGHQPPATGHQPPATSH